MRVDPVEILSGRLMVVAPHMDDEVLACGGTIALLPNKESIYVVYATDGTQSPAPIRSTDTTTPDLGELREEESATAMETLGVNRSNLRFLRLPEARLVDHLRTLEMALIEQIEEIRPTHILMPFRFDRHPDHLAINRVLGGLHDAGSLQASIFEYFVYYRWRLLPGRDVRGYIRAELLLEVDTTAVAARKRLALNAFTTQTTIFYAWQTRPILRSWLLDDTSRTPEFFIRRERSMTDTSIFSGIVPWIRLVHRVEPVLLKSKYILGASLKRVLTRND